MSKKTQFITHDFVDTFVREARQRGQHQPHSVAVLITDARGGHILTTLPQDAILRGNSSARVPPQTKLHPSDYVLNVAQELVKSVLYQTKAVGIDDLVYLGSTRGNRHIQGSSPRKCKHIHWVGYVVPGRSFYDLTRPSEAFPTVEWMRLREVMNLHYGSIVSDEKIRMILQAYIVLTRSWPNPPQHIAAVHQQLKEMDLLPKTPHSA